MSDDPGEAKQPEEQDHRHDTGLLSRLDNLQKLLAATAAVVVALGALGAAAYVARDSWQKAVGIAGSGSPTLAPGTANPAFRTSPPGNTPSSLTPAAPVISPTGSNVPASTSTLPPSSPSSPGSPSPSPRQPDTIGYGHISSVTSSGGSCAGPVTVTIVISSPASADRELWLMAIVMTGVPIHPVYYAKKELDNAAGQRTVSIQFYGATNGSFRNLVIVSSARTSFNWLEQNLANDGNPTWDPNRTTKPSDVTVISPSYGTTTRC
jgi:hypothetical protein